MKSKALLVCDLLDAAYGEVKWERHNPPLDELVLTILSQNTTAANCRAAFDRLRVKFPAWEQVARAGVSEIAEAIRPGGLAEIKAPRINAILEQLEALGSYDLSWLDKAPMDEARRYLENFHGVGKKTAACVLLFSLGKPVLPVDTHVYRVGWRVGLIPKVGADRSHELLAEQIPPERVYSFHINMVRHGREVCRARNPRHTDCVLYEVCDYVRGKD